MFALLLAIAAVFATLRIGGQAGETFQAAAHLYVGGLLGACVNDFFFAIDDENDRRMYWYFGIGLGLSLVEAACFLVSRFVT